MTPQWFLPMMLVSVLGLIALRPAVWGFSGSVVYALGQFGAFLSSEASEDPKQRRRAWLQLFTSVFFGVVAAEGFGPSLSGWIGPRVQPVAVWLAVGLSANAAWPIIETALLRFVSKRVGGEK